MSLLPGLRASASRASCIRASSASCASTSFGGGNRHTLLSTRSYADEADPLAEMKKAKAAETVMIQKHKQKVARAGGQRHHAIQEVDLANDKLPILEPVIFKDFEKRWLWVGMPREAAKFWKDLAHQRGVFAQLSFLRPLRNVPGLRWIYTTGFCAFVPRGFWTIYETLKARIDWLRMWVAQHNETEAVLKRCVDGGVLKMTPVDQRSAVAMTRWESIKDVFDLTHRYPHFEPSMQVFLQKYKAYYEAIARNDGNAVERLSVRSMREAGMRIARSSIKTDWELKSSKTPRIRWARDLPLPKFEESAVEQRTVQICCEFDTVQSLTTKGKGGKGQQTRTVRVVENIILTAVCPEQSIGFRLRDRVSLDYPKHMLTGEDLKRHEEKETQFAQAIQALNAAATSTDPRLQK